MAGRRLRPAAARAGRSSARASQRPRAPRTSTSDDLARIQRRAQGLLPLAHGGARVGEVHAQIALARGPHGVQRLPQMPPAELQGRERLAGYRLGHHPLREIEALLEVPPRVDQGAAAHPEVVEGVCGGLPVPPAPGRAAAVREVGAAHRTVGSDRFLDRPQDRAVLLEPLAPGATADRVVEHHPSPGREVRGRDQAGSVGPVLEQQPLPVGDPLDRPALERSEPAPQREVVAALDDVDRIELKAPHVFHEGQERAGGEAPGPRPGEVLAGHEEGSDGTSIEDGQGHGERLGLDLTPS